MKSMSRGWGDPDAVTSTMLSPQRTTTEPPACLAHFPVSTMISLPPTMAVSRTNGIRVLSPDWDDGVHVAGRSFVAWSLCPTSRPRLATAEGLDGTIKPARFPAFDDATVAIFLGSQAVWHSPARKKRSWTCQGFSPSGPLCPERYL